MKDLSHTELEGSLLLLTEEPRETQRGKRRNQMPPTEWGADAEPGGDLPSPEGSGRRLPGYLPSD